MMLTANTVATTADPSAPATIWSRCPRCKSAGPISMFIARTVTRSWGEVTGQCGGAELGSGVGIVALSELVERGHVAGQHAQR